MKATSRQITSYLIGLNCAALIGGYALRSPDLTATAQRQADIRAEGKEASFERIEAMQRAQTCILVRADTPLTDGAAAYFYVLRRGKAYPDKKRPMPHGTKVCDRFGNTGVVDTSDGDPVVSQISAMPSEEMEAVLKSRGLLGQKTPKKSKNRS
ncbi:MAG TPA: hypothetical protein V6D48_05785 [Oculatellaceae cyanobacterium]